MRDSLMLHQAVAGCDLRASIYGPLPCGLDNCFDRLAILPLLARVNQYFVMQSPGSTVAFDPVLDGATVESPRAATRTTLSPPKPRPLHQFSVTKLRSWRTGYARILALHDQYFCTYDPSAPMTNPKETNQWPYSSLTEWLAPPNETETILLQAGGEKLKFSCGPFQSASPEESPSPQAHAPMAVGMRSMVLTYMLRQQDVSGQAANVGRYPILPALRHHRTGQQSRVQLQLLPYGIAEYSAKTQERWQTYCYIDLLAVSFPAPDPQTNSQPQQQGIFLHFRQTGKILLYTILDNEGAKSLGTGRTLLYKILQEHCGALGMLGPADPLPMAPSCSVTTWLYQRQHIGTGPVVAAWTVTKTSSRRRAGGAVRRQLALTGDGLIVERDDRGLVVHVRKLYDLYALIRDPADHSHLTLEYTNGQTVSYTVANYRDAMMVSIFDAAIQLGQNSCIHMSDVASAGYCLALPPHPGSPEAAPIPVVVGEGTAKAAVAHLFQPTPVPQLTLRRVYTVATYVFALVSGEFALPQQSEIHRKEHLDFIQNLGTTAECATLCDACREFNASVQHPTSELPPSSAVDKLIVGTMGALFGLIKLLLQNDTSTALTPNTQRRHGNERVAGTMFQTLHRLARTTMGYKCSADLTTLRECLPYVWNIDDTFCKFSAFSVLNALLSGTNKDLPHVKRDMETEYVNKNVLLKSGGTAMVDGLVSSLLPPEDGPISRQSVISDLIFMVTSDILQSLLCSYHDTTSPEHFQLFVAALANRHRALMSTLRSHTPFVLENTALLLHLLSTHAPATSVAIRDAALSSAILLQHFFAATFSPLEGHRFLSRYLCSLWLTGPTNCDEKRLLKRMVPHGFLAYLNMPPLSRMEEDQLDALERDAVEGNITDQGAVNAAALALAQEDGEQRNSTSRDATLTAAGGTNTTRLRSRMALATNTSVHLGQPLPKENFRIFFHVLTQDHSLADLIWNQQTRRELRIALESELEYIRRETEARGLGAIAWNHQQFHVKYPSLENEVKVGDVYMRLWLQAGDGFIRSWDEPVRLFEHLFRRFLCEVDRDAKVRAPGILSFANHQFSHCML
jgi:DNAJ protein RME-8 N-terminal